MIRASLFALLCLTGCGGPAAAPAPEGKHAAADPLPVGDVLDYSLELAVGHRMDLSGAVADQEAFSWQDASGATHTVAAPADLKPIPEGLCIYLVTGADSKPVVPLQVVLIDYLEYCMVGPGPKPFSGIVRRERETPLIENGQPVVLKSIELMLQPSAAPRP